MRFELRKWTRANPVPSLIAHSRHKNPVNASVFLARETPQSLPGMPNALHIAVAIGMGYSAFGMGQRDLTVADYTPSNELSVSIDRHLGWEIVVIETDQYETDQATMFHIKNIVRKETVS